MPRLISSLPGDGAGLRPGPDPARRPGEPAPIYRTTETVEGLYENGTARVRGKFARLIGDGPIQVGDQVPVIWQDGQPTIHLTRIRRGVGTSDIVSGGIIEELAILGPFDLQTSEEGPRSLWYRNGIIAVKLPVVTVATAKGETSLNLNRVSQVKWGRGARYFVLRSLDPLDLGGAMHVFYIFRMRRKPGTLLTRAPQFDFVRLDRPSTMDISLGQLHLIKQETVIMRAIEPIFSVSPEDPSGPPSPMYGIPWSPIGRYARVVTGLAAAWGSPILA